MVSHVSAFHLHAALYFWTSNVYGRTSGMPSRLTVHSKPCCETFWLGGSGKTTVGRIGDFKPGLVWIFGVKFWFLECQRPSKNREAVKLASEWLTDLIDPSCLHRLLQDSSPAMFFLETAWSDLCIATIIFWSIWIVHLFTMQGRQFQKSGNKWMILNSIEWWNRIFFDTDQYEVPSGNQTWQWVHFPASHVWLPESTHAPCVLTVCHTAQLRTTTHVLREHLWKRWESVVETGSHGCFRETYLVDHPT